MCFPILVRQRLDFIAFWPCCKAHLFSWAYYLFHENPTKTAMPLCQALCKCTVRSSRCSEEFSLNRQSVGKVTERSSDLFKLTQQVSGTAGNRPQVSWSLVHCHSHSTPCYYLMDHMAWLDELLYSIARLHFRTRMMMIWGALMVDLTDLMCFPWSSRILSFARDL